MHAVCSRRPPSCRTLTGRCNAHAYTDAARSDSEDDRVRDAGRVSRVSRVSRRTGTRRRREEERAPPRQRLRTDGGIFRAQHPCAWTAPSSCCAGWRARATCPRRPPGPRRRSRRLRVRDRGVSSARRPMRDRLREEHDERAADGDGVELAEHDRHRIGDGPALERSRRRWGQRSQRARRARQPRSARARTSTAEVDRTRCPSRQGQYRSATPQGRRTVRDRAPAACPPLAAPRASCPITGTGTGTGTRTGREDRLDSGTRRERLSAFALSFVGDRARRGRAQRYMRIPWPGSIVPISSAAARDRDVTVSPPGKRSSRRARASFVFRQFVMGPVGFK